MHTFCVDINECDDSYHHNCSKSENEMCINTDGSFLCVCKVGFKMNEETKSCEGEKDKNLMCGLDPLCYLIGWFRYQ